MICVQKEERWGWWWTYPRASPSPWGDGTWAAPAASSASSPARSFSSRRDTRLRSAACWRSFPSSSSGRPRASRAGADTTCGEEETTLHRGRTRKYTPPNAFVRQRSFVKKHTVQKSHSSDLKLTFSSSESTDFIEQFYLYYIYNYFIFLCFKNNWY